MKRPKEEARPRDSEARVKKWLERVASDVRYVGGGEGPPDFVVRFLGDEIAVEVMRMLNGEGWPLERREAFERELKVVVESVKNECDTPRWHVFCRYDPKEPEPPKPKGPWVETVRNALRKPGPGNEIQLVPDASQVGSGVVIRYFSASNEGSFNGVSEDIGIAVTRTASMRIAACVAEKARKVRNGRRAQSFSRWWLILEDEVVVVHNYLSEEEWLSIKDRVRCCEGINQWNKVVLLSRDNRGESTAVYERPNEPPLE